MPYESQNEPFGRVVELLTVKVQRPLIETAGGDSDEIRHPVAERVDRVAVVARFGLVRQRSGENDSVDSASCSYRSLRLAELIPRTYETASGPPYWSSYSSYSLNQLSQRCPSLRALLGADLTLAIAPTRLERGVHH